MSLSKCTPFASDFVSFSTLIGVVFTNIQPQYNSGFVFVFYPLSASNSAAPKSEILLINILNLSTLTQLSVAAFASAVHRSLFLSPSRHRARTALPYVREL